MNRMDKFNKKKQIRLTLIYPIVIILLSCFLLILVVDYRANSSMGTNKIKIMMVVKKDSSLVEFNLFNKPVCSINLTFIKRDLSRIKKAVLDYSEIFSKIVYEAFKSY